MTDEQEEPLPLSVLTGFLGSGKTTVLRHLLTDPAMAKVAVIINEFGEVGLDHLLVEKVDENTVLLASGCLCCTIRDDLTTALRSLAKRRHKGEIPAFDRVVIETTGLADPAPILHTLIRDPGLGLLYRLDGVVTTVDAATGWATLDAQPEAVKQAAVADRLLLTKGDLVSADDKARLMVRLREINPAAPLLDVHHGVVAPAQLFNAGLYNPDTKSMEVRRWLAAEAYEHHDHEEHDHGGHDHHHTPLDRNRHDDRIRAFALRYDKPVNWDRFVAWVEMIVLAYGADLLRMKGLLNVEGEARPVAVHGVQHLFHPPAQLPAWPDNDRRSQLVFITRGLDQLAFERTLKAFLEGPTTGAAA